MAVTKKELQQVAREFNDIMNLKPPLRFGSKIKVDKLKEHVIEAGEEVRPDDKFSPEVEEVLVKLEIRKAVGAAEPEAKPKSKKDKQKEKTPPSPSGVERSCFGSRVGTQAGTIDELLKKGADIETIVKKAVCSRARAKGHIAYLKNKGFKVTENKEGVVTVAE